MGVRREQHCDTIHKRYNKLTEAIDSIKSVQAAELGEALLGPSVAARLGKARAALDVAYQEIERRRIAREW